MMERDSRGISRRDLMMLGTSLLALAAAHPTRGFAQAPAQLDVASAGSFRSMLERSLKTQAAQTLKLDLHAHSDGADAVAQSIINSSLQADVFIPITASPMLTVMHAGKALAAQPIARTEVVLVYSPQSRFAPRFQAAAQGRGNWWEILQEPGLRFGRGNPAADPGARAILFVMMLAARKYNQPDLVQKVLGPTLNADQIVPGVQERLQSGAIDAAASYKTGAIAVNLPYVVLPGDLNLSRPTIREEHPDLKLLINGKTYNPEPLVFYAALLKGAANPAGASAFIDWLKGSEAQALLCRNQYDLPQGIALLHA